MGYIFGEVEEERNSKCVFTGQGREDKEDDEVRMSPSDQVRVLKLKQKGSATNAMEFLLEVQIEKNETEILESKLVL